MHAKFFKDQTTRYRKRVKMKKIVGFYVLIALLSVFSIFAVFINPVKADANVIIRNNHTAYIDEGGRYFIAGEVENVGDVTVRGIIMTATLYNSSGEVVATPSNEIMMSYLLPGRKSPFGVLLWDVAKSALVHHYTLNLTFQPYPEGRQLGLEIISNSYYVDGTGMKHVNGTIRNTGSQTATYVYVAATCYNETGYVVDVHYTWTDPMNINPGQTAPFDIEFVRRARGLLTTSWTLAVESQEYEMIPEFPFSICIYALLAASSIVIVAIKRKS